MKLLLGPKGEALHLRGVARAEYEATVPKRTVEVPWVDGAVNRVQLLWYLLWYPHSMSSSVGMRRPGECARIRLREYDVVT